MSRLVRGVNDLYTINPNLAKEWNYDKNIRTSPSDVSVSSNKKYWWICDKGHEWRANVNSRNRGTGCPVCGNRIILAGFNDLLSQKPELAKEWNYEKNQETPEEICYKSNKRVWWKCSKCLNEWETSVYDRYKGTGCPFCSGRRPIRGINDIATTNPELIMEWDSDKNGKLTPFDVSAGSSRRVWWKCKYGHEWKSLVNSRALKHTGCPVCAKNLKTSFPEQAIYFYICKEYPDAINGYNELGRELDVFIPQINVAIEYDGWIWHNLKSSVKNDKLKNDICRNNGIKLIRVREEGCEEINDDNVTIIKCLANDTDSLAIAIDKVLSILGIKGDIDIDRDRNSILEQYLTAYRNNSFALKYPEIAKEWHPTKNGNITPDMINAKTNKKYWWICKNGHEWEAPPNNRINHGCPYCSGHRVLIGKTDLETVNPELAKEWHPIKNGDLKPSDIKPHSYQNVWWLGKCGHEWQAHPSDRMNGNNCPFCSGQRVLKGFNDLLSQNPELMKEWDYEKNIGLNPDEIHRLSVTKVWWKCKKGHEWIASVSNRAKGSSCPYCMGKKACSGENDLATVFPDLIQEWNYERNKIKPDSALPFSGKKVWWKCKIGHEWEATINNRAKGNGCPYCAGKIAISGVNDLKTLKSEIANLWDYEKNDDVPEHFSVNSGKKVWWKCDKGHSWYYRIQSQVRAKGCPYCLKRRLLIGFNDLQTTHPEIAKEWHPTKNDRTPQDVMSCNDIKVWWLGNCNHEWEASVMSRTKDKHPTGCPYCAGKKVLEGYNDLKTLMPDLVEEWDYDKNDIDPTEVTVGSAKEIWWKCKFGHEWKQQIYEMAIKKSSVRCPICYKSNCKRG